MAIDPQKALGAEIPGGPSGWDRDQVILYHLGVGAGVPPTDANELAYTYEKSLKVLPSFGVIPVFRSLGAIGGVPGLAGEFNPALLLHGEQDIVLHEPIPVEATASSKGRVVGLYDKGKAAVAVMELDTTDAGGKKLFTNRFTLFLRGAGGFGGERGPDVKIEPPARAPDFVKESATLPQQALLYRLCGDKNPLHADPDFAKLGGFDRPILHGLCSYGIVCKAVVDAACGGDVKQVARWQARFAGVVFPGETLVTSMWQDGKMILVTAKTRERDTPVLSNAALTLR